MRKSDVITGDGIRPGLAIVGLSSTGQASYEAVENSGIGSNGLTSARHDLLSAYYRKKYPETFDPQIDSSLVYTGPFRMSDKLPGSKLSVGEALLSPTRSYAPVIRALLSEQRARVRGIVHCSGGGQTKCLRFGRSVHFVKDTLLPIPAIFKTIQKVSGTSWKEMYQVYNMGHRMEIYCLPKDVRHITLAAQSFGIQAQQVGHTLKSDVTQNQLTLSHGKQTLRYLAP
jgi:phosphoribosylformylglycinamidine cyclo-ligase